MANTMKAAVVRELGKPLAIDQVPVPQPNDNQILVRLAATGALGERELRRIRIGRPGVRRQVAAKSRLGPAAPIVCAGVTVYKGLKETDVKPGEWVVISGIGGLRHMAVQYAKAMAMHVAAIDVHPEKLARAQALGAEIALDARSGNAAGEMQRLTRGAFVTAVSPNAFEQAFDMLRSRGTMSLVGLPPGRMPLPIFDMVLKRITVRNPSWKRVRISRRRWFSREAECRRALLVGQAGEHQRHLRAHGRWPDRRSNRRRHAMSNDTVSRSSENAPPMDEALLEDLVRLMRGRDAAFLRRAPHALCAVTRRAGARTA